MAIVRSDTGLPIQTLGAVPLARYAQLLPIYEEAAAQDLILVMHTGYDIAFPRIRRADPKMVCEIQDRFPALKFVATHLGAWQQWDEVERYLMGRKIRMEISFAMQDLGTEQARRIIMEHPEQYVFFGTDSPWTDQGQTLSLLKKMSLPEKKLKRILAGNARDLLG